MAPLANDSSRLVSGRRWDDGFIARRLLGLGVGSLVAGSAIGVLRLVQIATG